MAQMTTSIVMMNKPLFTVLHLPNLLSLAALMLLPKSNTAGHLLIAFY